MSSGGRVRQAMGVLRVVMLALAAAAVCWGGWEAALAFHSGGAQELTRGDRVRSLVLVTDGVLGRDWLARTLAIPPDATLVGIDIDALRARLMADGQVRSAEISRNFPDRITVRVSERSPVARMMVQDGAGAPAMLLVGRDGVPFTGRGFDAAMVDSLPWIDGVTLCRSGASFAAIPGMPSVSELLATARLEADDLYRTWRVISLNRMATDGDIEVAAKSGMRVTFSTREDYLRQIARLDFLVASATDPTKPLAEVDLALGSQVPVKFGAAPPMLDQPPVNTTGATPSRATISFPSISTPRIDLKT
jgi:cell division protein FtsQ